MAARPATPASPKNHKVRGPQPGQPLYGCEHLQRLFNQDQTTTNTSIQHYKSILRSIFDTTPLIPQTAKAIDGQIVTSLTPTYLCLQCPSTLTEEDRTKHGTKKSHRFCTWERRSHQVGPGWSGIRGLLTARRCRLEERLPLLPDV